jgi:flagellar motor component MotA
MSRFDPHPDKSYAACTGCEEVFPTRPEMRAHLTETFKNGKSHSARITNASRLERIENELESLADDALGEFIDEAHRLMEDGDATEEEITEAMRHIVADFSDAWEQSK